MSAHAVTRKLSRSDPPAGFEDMLVLSGRAQRRDDRDRRYSTAPGRRSAGRAVALRVGRRRRRRRVDLARAMTYKAAAAGSPGRRKGADLRPAATPEGDLRRVMLLDFGDAVESARRPLRHRREGCSAPGRRPCRDRRGAPASGRLRTSAGQRRPQPGDRARRPPPPPRLPRASFRRPVPAASGLRGRSGPRRRAPRAPPGRSGSGGDDPRSRPLPLRLPTSSAPAGSTRPYGDPLRLRRLAPARSVGVIDRPNRLYRPPLRDRLRRRQERPRRGTAWPCDPREPRHRLQR